MADLSRQRCGGFTYLAALIIIVIMGIMLGMMGQTWTTIMKREREEELLFRGMQIRNAIERWQTPRAGQTVVTPLKDLKDLVKDPRSLSTVRYLRQDPNKDFLDPITGKEWVVIKDPVKGIIGVASSSEETPLRQKGFADKFAVPDSDTKLKAMFDAFEGKTKYSDWLFVYGQAQAQLSISGATGGGVPTTLGGTTSR